MKCFALALCTCACVLLVSPSAAIASLIDIDAVVVPTTSIYAWGNNQGGCLGDGSTTNRNSPVATLNMSGVTAIGCGSYHSMAIKNGALYAWGDNQAGAIGDGTTSNRLTPVLVNNMSSGVSAFVGGNFNSFAIKNGALYSWGNNAYGTLGDGTKGINRLSPSVVVGMNGGVTAVAVATFHALALKNGALYGWGYNLYGGVGNGTVGTQYNSPVAVPGLETGVTDIAVGSGHSVVMRNGALYAWGFNGHGQLGDGTTTDRSTPFAVPGMESGVTAFDADGNFCLAIKNGQVWAWGSNRYGQLGDGTYTDRQSPKLVSGLSNIVDVTIAENASIALAADGSAWVWGNNLAGQLGLGVSNIFPTPQRLLPPAGYMFTSIDSNAAGDHTLAMVTVPEPSALALLGLAGLIAMRRR